jgi:hypothetical protein
MKKKSIKKAILMLFAIMMLAVQISVCVSALNAAPSEYEISDDHSSMAMATGHEHTQSCFKVYYGNCNWNGTNGFVCNEGVMHTTLVNNSGCRVITGAVLICGQ